MPIRSYTYSGPSSGAIAFELLAKIQEAQVAVNASPDEKPTVTVVTTNPFVGTSTTSTSDSWAGCAKTLSGLIPSLGLWMDHDEILVEWIDSAAAVLGMCGITQRYYHSYQSQI